MASYLRAWWFGTTTDSEDIDVKPAVTSSASPQVSSPQSPTSPAPFIEPTVTLSVSAPEETQEATASDDEDAMNIDEDIPPAFPSQDSIQRSSASRSKATARSDSALMPPPALPDASTSQSSARRSTSNGVSMTSSTLPTSNTLRIPTASGASSNTLQLPPSTTRPPPTSSKKRGKVALAPGHSPLDWAALKASGQDLRGTPSLMRVTPSQLKLHKKRDDAWSSFNGKVYNITPYLSFHPGGEKELMRVAGRDGTKLFALTHAWVNVEFMLDECMVGFLVQEPSSAA